MDTQGWLLAACVHPANIQDREGAQLVLAPLRGSFPRLEVIWADAGYRGQCVLWVAEHVQVRLEIVKHWWTGRSGVSRRSRTSAAREALWLRALTASLDC